MWACPSSVYVLWRNAYSTPSLIFHSDCFLLFLTYRSSLYVLDSNPLSDTVWFASIFFQMFSHPVHGVLWSRKCLVCLFLLLLPVLLVSYTRSHCQMTKHPWMFISKSLIVLALTFSSLIHFEFIRFKLTSFACGYGVFLALFVKKTVLSTLNGLGILIKNHVTIYARVYFWAFCFIRLVHVCS